MRNKHVEGYWESEVGDLLVKVTHLSLNRHISSIGLKHSFFSRTTSNFNSHFQNCFMKSDLNLSNCGYYLFPSTFMVLFGGPNSISQQIFCLSTLLLELSHDLIFILFFYHFTVYSLFMFSHTLRNSMNICQVEFKWWFNSQE